MQLSFHKSDNGDMYKVPGNRQDSVYQGILLSGLLFNIILRGVCQLYETSEDIPCKDHNLYKDISI